MSNEITNQVAVELSETELDSVAGGQTVIINKNPVFYNSPTTVFDEGFTPTIVNGCKPTTVNEGCKPKPTCSTLPMRPVCQN